MYDSTADIVARVNGSPQYLGTITAAAATVKNNRDTAVAFAIPPGSVLLLDWDSAGWMLPGVSQAQSTGATGGTSNAVVNPAAGNPALLTTGANGKNRQAGDEWMMVLAPDEDLLQVCGNGATVNVKVFALIVRR